MLKSLSSRSVRSSSMSSTNTQTPSTSYLSPSLPPIPPTPDREIPAILLVAPTPGTRSGETSPLVEKRRTRTLVPRRSVLGKENRPQQPQQGNMFLGTSRPIPSFTLPDSINNSASADTPTRVTGLVAREFAAHHEQQRMFHSVGPSAGLSIASTSSTSQATSSTSTSTSTSSNATATQDSLRGKTAKKTKRVLVETRAYPDGGQVEVVRETIGRSAKPFLGLGGDAAGSVRGTVNGGSFKVPKVRSVRAFGTETMRHMENVENAGSALVVKKKKSRGTLESIRWALGDRTNGARKAEKAMEKEKERERTQSLEKEKEKERVRAQSLEKERARVTSQGSVTDRPKTRLTINTRVMRPTPLDTPSASSTFSPTSATPGTDSEAAQSGGERKWKWTIGRKRAKSPGPSLSNTFDRPAHTRTTSLDPSTLMAMQHKEETEEEIEAYIKSTPRPASVDGPMLMYTATPEVEAEGRHSPLSSPTLTIRHLPSEVAPARPLPVETAPVDFGFEPKTLRKTSVGSVESHAGSGTSTSSRKSSIGGLFGQSSGENASNTGSLAIRAMRSVRSMASLARLGGWVKGDEEKGKEGTVKEKKKRRVRKKVVAEDDTATSGESWEAGALSQDPTFTARIGKPISKQPLRVKDERAGLGVRRGGEDGDWVAGDRKGSGSSSVEPSTTSFVKQPTTRVSRGSSGTSDYAPSTMRTLSSRAGSSSIEPRPNRNSAGLELGNAYPGDNSWVGTAAKVEAATNTVKVRTERDPARRARKGIMGLFDLPTPEEDKSQVEVRGVKIDKGRVKERVREFEARADEQTGPAVNFSSTRSRATVGLTSNAAARSTASLGRMMGSAVDSQRLSYIQEREYTLATARCVSVPLLDSPERPTTQRPTSEHLLRPRSQAMADEHVPLDVVSAANSDLSDLINRLDLSATPDSRFHASPTPVRCAPTWVEESPSRTGPLRRGAHPSLTSLKGYDHPSTLKPMSLSRKEVVEEREDELDVFGANVTLGASAKMRSFRQASPPASLDGLPELSLGSRPVRGHQYPRPRSGKASGSSSGRSTVGSGTSRGRMPLETRRHAGMNGTMGEDSMLMAEDSDGPDSDIPDELQTILAGQSEDEGPLPSPGMPPTAPLPTPDQSMEMCPGGEETEVITSEEELDSPSRKSFDFTGELGALKSGSRNSFVEALVTAFKTPSRAGGADLDDQLELSIHPTERSGTADRDPVVDTSDARTPTFTHLLQPSNKKSNGQLNLDFQFGNSQTETTPRHSDEVQGADASLIYSLANSTFALALANLTSAGSNSSHERHSSIGMASDASSNFHIPQGENSRHSHERSESEISQSMSSLGNMLHSAASDPFGFNQAQINLSQYSWSRSAETSRESQHHESMTSIPSDSSYGRVIAGGQEDPFDYETLMRELDEASQLIEDSTNGLERSVSRRRQRNRRSMDSDRSSFYSHNGRRDSALSFVSAAPPVSFHNRQYGRQFGHTQNLPVESASSLAPGGRRSRPVSVSSAISDISEFNGARPGLGDKMFQTAGAPLMSIMASPSNSEASVNPQFYYADPLGRRHSYVSDRRQSYISDRRGSYEPSVSEQQQHRMSFMSYDSLLDGPGNDCRASIDLDSVYEGRPRTSSISSVSVFGDDQRRRRRNNFRPVSIISVQSEISVQDDETMVSMIGGGNARVRRKSVGTNLMLDASPCMRAEKRARDLAKSFEASRIESTASTSYLHADQDQDEDEELSAEFTGNSVYESSPSKGRSQAPPRPFSRPRPAAARLSVASDLEEHDFSARPTPASNHTRPLSISARKAMAFRNSDMTTTSRKRASLMCTAEPPDTPPLSIAGSDASSISGGSQSSIDVSKLMGMLGDTPTSESGRRARAKGHGHRRRTSPLSRSTLSTSTTQEDLPRSSNQYLSMNKSDVKTSVADLVIIVDPEAQLAELAEMIGAGYELTQEQMASIARYYQLRNEAMETVARSQKIWQDTDFSLFALSTFTPPSRSSDIKAMLDESQAAYAPLPAEFQKRHRNRLSRCSTRASPYPAEVTRSVRSMRTRLPAESVEQALALLPPSYEPVTRRARTVQESPMVSHMGMANTASPMPVQSAPLAQVDANSRSAVVTEEKSFKQTIRRTALGWGKKKVTVNAPPTPATATGGKRTGAPTPAKENEGHGMLSNPTLRINRPRPKGRSMASTSHLSLRV